MVIDTSAIFAALAGEPDGDLYRKAIKAAPVRLMSAVTLLETRIVLFARFGPDAITAFDELMDLAGVAIVPFDRELADAALTHSGSTVKGKAIARN